MRGGRVEEGTKVRAREVRGAGREGKEREEYLIWENPEKANKSGAFLNTSFFLDFLFNIHQSKTSMQIKVKPDKNEGQCLYR